jgi:hypothetical protein
MPGEEDNTDIVTGEWISGGLISEITVENEAKA